LMRERRVRVGGVITAELREGGVRRGFTIHDLETGREVVMASADSAAGPRIGRYRVDVEAISDVGAKAVKQAIERADVVVIDEIGPMELLSDEMRRAIAKAMEADKPVLGVVHWRVRDPLLDSVLAMPGVKVVEVRLDNRDSLAPWIVDEILDAI